MFSKALILLYLSQSPLLAYSRLEPFKTETMAGIKRTLIAPTVTYSHGNVKGKAHDSPRAYVWGTVHMELDPSFGKDIEKLTMLANQQPLAQQHLTNAHHGTRAVEVNRLVRQMRCGQQRPSIDSTKDGPKRLYSIPAAFIGTWTEESSGAHRSDGELPFIIRARQVEGHEWGGEFVSITQNAPGDITVVIKGAAEGDPYQSRERWVIVEGGQAMMITVLGQSSFSRTVYRVSRLTRPLQLNTSR